MHVECRLEGLGVWSSRPHGGSLLLAVGEVIPLLLVLLPVLVRYRSRSGVVAVAPGIFAVVGHEHGSRFLVDVDWDVLSLVGEDDEVSSHQGQSGQAAVLVAADGAVCPVHGLHGDRGDLPGVSSQVLHGSAACQSQHRVVWVHGDALDPVTVGGLVGCLVRRGLTWMLRVC